MLGFLARWRAPWLTGVARGICVAGSGWGAAVAGLSAVALTMAFRRWRHLLVFLCSLLLPRACRDLDHPGWPGRARTACGSSGAGLGIRAAAPVAVLTIFLVGIAYCLAVPGRPRSYAKAAVAVGGRRVLPGPPVPGRRSRG